ncbi:MAG: hypothetical protein IKV87_04935 [Methanobrevibacter sp.]|nr:hypothetical protein [Methanobrevibacter sp.]
MLFGFLIIGAASAANDFKINDGFDVINEYHSLNEENGMHLCIWDYNDELIQESYLQNNTDYRIISGDNNTYNTSYNCYGALDNAISYLRSGNIALDRGILEVAEVDGDKYIFYTYIEGGNDDDWQLCYDELMKFNENNNIEPLADAI